MTVGSRRAGVLRPNGTLITYGDGPEVHQDTVQCCHCGRHWIWLPGSGRQRGFCTKCNGITCGNAKCDVCVPAEQQMENLENNRDVLYRPIVSSVVWSGKK